MNNRLRQEIIDLNTGIKYLNESMAAKAIGKSRYLIHKSLMTQKICKGVAFAYYCYGMDYQTLLKIYVEDVRKNKRRTN